MLFGAGLAGGVVTALVGGASLITFPALLGAGLPAVVANISNSVALTPASFIAVLADLGRLPRWDRWFLGLMLVCVSGSVAGDTLLLATPEHAFTAVVPALIGLATVLFGLSGRIRQWILARARASGGRRALSDRLPVLAFAPVAVYGGYFGAGMSVMLLAMLSFNRPDDFLAINVIKTLLAGLTSFVAVFVFLFEGIVAWPPTMVMMTGTLVGGFLGGRLARVLPLELVRWIVITVGTILTAVYAWRYWVR